MTIQENMDHINKDIVETNYSPTWLVDTTLGKDRSHGIYILTCKNAVSHGVDVDIFIFDQC